MALDKEQLARLQEHRDQNEQADLQEALTFAEKAPEATSFRRIERLTQESGYPREVVERNPDEVEGKMNLTRANPAAMLRDSPRTAQWLQEGNNAPMSKDNFEVMQALEKFTVATPHILPNTGRLINERVDQFLGNVVEFAGTLEDEFTKTMNSLGVPQPGIKFGPDGMSFEWDIGEDVVSGESESGLRRIGRDKSNLTSGYVPHFTWENFKGDMSPANLAGYMFEQGLPSAVEMAAALVSMPVFIAANTQRLAEERVDAEGLDRRVELTDLAKTLPAAVASSLLERFSGKGALGALTTSVRATGLRTGLREIGKSGVVEGATEFAQEHIEYVAERFGVATMSLAEGADRGLAAAVVGTGMGTTLRGVSVLAEVATNRSERGVAREINSSVGQSHIDGIIANIQENTLLQESPEAMAQYLKDVGGDTMFYFTPEAVQEAVDAGLPIPAHMVEQLGNDQDVAVSLDKFGMDIVPSEQLLEQLRPHMKRDPEHLTQSEIQNRDDTGVRDMIARAQEHKETLTEAENIHKSITDQLVATGRMSTYSAKYSAQLIPAYITTKHAELKARGIDVTVEQLYKDMNFRVERLTPESSVSGEIFQQSLPAATLWTDEQYDQIIEADRDEYTRALEKFGEEGMTVEARKARAEEMGYDTSQIWYHGSPDVFDSFDSSRIGTGKGGTPKVFPQGHYFTNDINAARMYGEPRAFFLKKGEVLDGNDFPMGMAAYDSFNEGTGDSYISSVGDVMVIRDPNNIRSIEAAFDPARADEPTLLAQSPVPVPAATPAATPEVQAEQKLERQRNAIGMYSAVEMAVIDMKLPQWKAGKDAPGIEIFNKLKKTQGIGQEELLWLGLEEFLTGIPKAKFPRKAVVEFVRQNGVLVEETVADESEVGRDEYAEVDLNFSESIDEDSTNWDHRTDEWMYDYKRLEPDDRTEEFYFWNDDEAREEYVEKYGHTPSEGQMEVVFQEAANEAAEAEYMENPYKNYHDSEYDVDITGNEDIGYTIHVGGSYVESEIYSFNEAEIQVRDYLVENGIASDENANDETVAKWGPEGGDYITDQIAEDHPERYEEFKLKLPAMPFDFYETVHFPDRNIVAFIRKTSRQIPASVPEVDPAPVKPTPYTPITEALLASDTIPPSMWIKKHEILWSEMESDPKYAENVAQATKNWKRAPRGQRESWLRNANEQPKQVREGGDAVDTFFIDEMQSDLQQLGTAKGIKRNRAVDELQLSAKESRREFEELVTVGSVIGINHARVEYNKTRDDDSKMELVGGTTSQRDAIPYEAPSILDEGVTIWHTLSRFEFTEITYEVVRSDMKPKTTNKELAEIHLAVIKILETDPSFDLKEAKAVLAKHDASVAEMKAEREGAPDAPFKKDAWMKLAVKRAIMLAIENNDDAIAWADAGVLEDRWSKAYREAYMNQYNRKMPSLFKSLLKVAPIHLDMDGQPYVNEDFSKWEVVEEESNPGGYVVRDSEGKAVTQGMRGETYEAGVGRLVTNEEIIAGAIENSWTMPEGYWTIPLSRELKESVRAEGFTLFQEGETRARGEIQLLDNERIIRLSNTSDLSTFLHETGHLFLESEKMFAEKYGLSANQEAILKMLGVESYDQIGRKEHELFARTFEDYLRTGKAPSMRLRDAFSAFARWLSHIYANIARIGTKLDPEVVELFDRLLATEVEIQEVLNAGPYIQYFKSQEQAGVSDAEWAEYLKKVEKRNSRTQMTLTEKVLKEYRLRRKAEWKEEREPLRLAEEARLAEQPEYMLIEDLKNEKMDYHAVAELLGVTKLPTGKILSNSKTGGQDPEALAEKYGYDTVKDMLNVITSTKSITKQSMENAQGAMIAKYGDILNDGTLDQQVQDAAHNDAQKELLLAELRMITKNKRKKPTNRKMLAWEANRIISSMKHTEINPDKYYRAEVRAAEKEGKGESPEAERLNKEKQVANHYLYREARRVKDDVARQIKYLKAAWTRKYSQSKVDGEYANAIKQYAGMYNAKKKPEERRIAAQKFLTWLNGQKTGGVQLTLKDQNIVAALGEDGNLDPNFELKRWNDLTADEVYSVYEMVKHLRYVGGVEAVAKNAALKKETDSVAAAVLETGTKRRVKDEQTKWDTLKNSFSHIINTLPNLRNFVNNLDGDWADKGGAVFDVVYRRLSAAENMKLVMTKQFYENFTEQMGDFYKAGLSDSRSSREKVRRSATPDDPFTLTANGRFMLAVYWGTESSRDAIMAGHNVTESEVMEMMNYLTPAQLELVNSLWAFNESMAKPLFEAGIKRDGVAPAKLPNAPFEVNGVQMTGGHMSLHYQMAMPEVRLDESSLAQTMQNGLVPAKVTALHSRKGSGGRMVDLNTHNITKSIDENAHYIGYAEVGMELQRILGSKDVKQAIIDTRGEGFYRAFMQTLQGVTTNRVEAEMYPMLAHAVTTLKSAKSAMYLMYNVKNIIQQLGSFYPAVREAGPINYAMEAIKFFGTGFHQNVEFVHSRDPQMANRIAHMNRESAEALKKAVRNTPHARAYAKVMQGGFTPHVILDLAISYPLWMAAYNRSLAKSGDEAKAAIDAAVAVNKSVGTGLDIGMGKALHSNQSAHIKLLTLFASWFNSTVFQRAYEATKGGTDFANMKAVEALLITPAITMMISEAIVMNIPGMPWGDEDKDQYEGFLVWFVRNMARFNSAAIPLMGGMISEIDGMSPSNLIQEAQALPGTTIRAIIKTTDGSMSKAEGFEEFIKIVGTIVSMPGSGNTTRIADFTESYNQGAEGDNINVIDMYQAVVEGRDKNRK